VSIKPGDLIQWVYDVDKQPVNAGVEIYSTIDQRWCYVGSEVLHLCIAVFEDTIVWFNDKGLFHAHVADSGDLHVLGGRGLGCYMRVDER